MTVTEAITHQTAETRAVEPAGVYPDEVAAEVNAFVAGEEGRGGA
jgi:hypothetical protein